MTARHADGFGTVAPPVVHDIRAVDRSPNRCATGVERAGEYEPCDKTAVAALSMWWEGEWNSWAVCAYHAHMMGGRDDCELIPLRNLIRGHA